MWSVWLLFCDFDFHSVCPLMDKDKRFMEDSWWERLTAGKTESWILLNIHWKDWCWSWSSNTLATWWEELTYVKRPWYWERLKVGGKGNDRGWDGWMASPTRWPSVWVRSGVDDGQGSLACCSPWGHKESDTTEWLNWLRYISMFWLQGTYI